MLSRRGIVTAATGAAWASMFPWSQVQAQGDEELGPLAGRADFAQAWTSLEAGSDFGWAPPDLPSGYGEAYAAAKFATADEVYDYFRGRTSKTFSEWFNEAIAGKGIWQTARISGPNVERNFREFWTNYLRSGPMSLTHFLAYMSIFVNECGGNLTSVTEKVGFPGHPGLAYPFNTITMGNVVAGKWRKSSYNQSPNILAGKLFQSAEFNAAHGELNPGSVQGSTDPVWLGQVYPQGSVSTSTNISQTGYLLQADFYKFRGRGLIQTTWRSNYRRIAQFVKDYAGDNKVLNAFKDKWKGIETETVCTISRDSDWDAIFEKTDGIVTCAAVFAHASQGNYLPLASTTEALNGNGPGSLQVMGDRIGGRGYGAKLKGRFVEVAQELGT